MIEVALATLVFSITLTVVSYRFNRWFSGDSLRIEPYRLALTATAVLLLAIVAESVINPLFEWWRGAKLWEYRILPLHDHNVSALAVMIWSAYGVHLYFMQQSLGIRLPQRWNTRFGKAFILGLEAPLLFEVLGNLTFLRITDSYYAYYLPGDLGHLTSFQVIPVYIVCIFLGLRVLDMLTRLPRHAALPAVLLVASLGFLANGQGASDPLPGAMTSTSPSMQLQR